MDTSETYQKMCDCPQIQKQRNKYADFNSWDFLGEGKKESIWLPRQDQIQEMMIKERFGDFGTHWDMCIDIPIQFVAKNPKLELSSMEQIWLSCYMLAIHQKIWDGEKWVKK